MKKAFVAVFAAASLVACTSVETATVSGSEIAANGEAVAVVQATAIGLSAIFHMVDLVQADLDIVVNKLLVAEAKAMGASKVDIKTAWTTPRNGIFALGGGIISYIAGVPPMATATGVAVK
ncbi:MAG: hypothetical protein ACOZIN_22555 [Myxococcota bacterium]